MAERIVTVKRIAAGLGLSGLVAAAVLTGCSSKSDQSPTTSTPASPTEKSMTEQGPNSFAPTVLGTTPTLGANNNNTVSVPGPPHPPGPPGGAGVGAHPGGSAGGRH